MTDKSDKKPFNVLLKELRESQEINLQSIADATKINIQYLKLIEKGNFDAIPQTFLRLFIKSYSEFLKVDSEQILNKYEEEKNISKKNIFKSLALRSYQDKKQDEIRTLSNKEENFSITNDLDQNLSINQDKTNIHHKSIPIDKTEKKTDTKSEVKSKLIFDDANNINSDTKFNLKESYFFKPKKIFSILFTSISIISIYLLISYLNVNQKEKIEITHFENSHDDISATNINNIIDDVLLSSTNFDKNKLIQEKSYKLKFNINSPYIFKIVTNKKTKIYISYDNNDGERKEECNIIAKKDSLLKYKKENNIYFDLWSANDVQIDIDNNSLSKYLGNKDVSVRGAFEPKNKLLHLKFYSR